MAKRRMTAIEKDHFLKQVERKGKAMALPESERAKWQKEYDKIVDYLRENYKSFILSNIIRSNRYKDIKIFKLFLDHEKDGLMKLTNQAINEGNAEDLQWYCWLMHLRYMCMWKVGIDALQQESGRHDGETAGCNQ